MRKDLSAIGLGLVLSGLAVLSSFAADPATVSLRGHVPAIVSGGKAQAIGRVAPDTVLDLSIGLPVRNREALTHLVEQVSDPKSPSYGHYLTPAEFTGRFGPTDHDYQAVIDFAHEHGLTVTRTHANHMLLNVTGKAADVENAFGVKLDEYRHPTEARTFYAPDSEPSVPVGLAVQDISGLDSFRQPHANYRLKPGQTPSKSMPAPTDAAKIKGNATTGSGPQGNYVGDDFRHAYAPGTTLNGGGQTIALVQFDGYLASDIAQYESLFNRTNVPLRNVLLDGFSGAPTGNGGEIEVSLDIEMVISMAPALAGVVVYEGDPINFHPNDVLNQIAVDDTASQVSCSWTWTGGPNPTTDQIFQEMIVQGQSFFHSSADFDAFFTGEVDNPNIVLEPSSNPFITQVGGTTLTMTNAGATYVSETVWNWDIRYGPGEDGVGSSGGISSFYSIPSWQSNINMTLAQGSQSNRNIPDVAMTGDDTLVIADGGVFYTGTGGTSIASPLWAGFTALINQQALINGHAVMGFINPALYGIATSPNYNNCFNDIVTDNNTWSQSPNLFLAVSNYDLCTGLGTPKGVNLISALLSQVIVVPFHISPPPPPYPTNMAAVAGGNPNGTWELFIQDDTPINSGFISNGWVLSLSVADIVGTSGDLQLLMSDSSSNIFVGQTVTFVLSVTNYGPSISTNDVVVDTLPLGVTVVSTNATQGTVTRSGTTLVWNIGTLPVGSGAQMVATVRALGLGTLVDSAIPQTGTPDPNPDDDFASATVNVVPLSAPLFPQYNTNTHTFQINVPGPTSPPLTVVMQASGNMMNSSWVSIYTNSPPFTFSDPAAGNYTNRFYRALLIP